jgi:hypothetical protein
MFDKMKKRIRAQGVLFIFSEKLARAHAIPPTKTGNVYYFSN